MHTQNKHAAFVLGMCVNGLGVTRSLGREGIPVIGVDRDPAAEGLSSRYCTSLASYDPTTEPERLLNVLLKAAERLSEQGILFATTDAYQLFISRYRNQLSERFRFAIASEQILEGVMNKRTQYEMAMRVGTMIPTTCFPKTQSDVENLSASLQYPVFVKPYYSHVWQEHFRNKGFVVQNSSELLETYRVVFSKGLDAMVQSIVHGPNSHHFKVCGYFAADGTPVSLFVTQKIRQYPCNFGVGTMMRSTHNQEVLDLGLRHFLQIGYRGIGSIEFKKDERDGKYRMIELNSRLWAQNVQATYAGINFPLLQYRELTGQPIMPAFDYKDGVQWFDAFQDFQSFWWHRKHLGLRALQWLKSWIGSDSYAYFASDDLGPGWNNSHYGLKYIKLPLYFLRVLLAKPK